MDSFIQADQILQKIFSIGNCFFPIIDVDILAEFLANTVSHADSTAEGQSYPPGQTTKTDNDSNDKNDSKDNSKNDQSTQWSSSIRETPVRTFLFSIGFIFANGRRHHKRQNQNDFKFHFAWQNFSKVFYRFLFQLSSCSCSDWISNDGNFLTHFDFTEKISCLQLVLAGKLTRFKISRKNCWKCVKSEKEINFKEL